MWLFVRFIVSLADAWKITDFRRLLIGNGVNMLGSSIFIIGMGWTIAEVGGPKAYGMVFNLANLLSGTPSFTFLRRYGS